MLNLFPLQRKPYIIWSPGYNYWSSGVRALHLLCHALNVHERRTNHYPSFKAFLWPESGQGFAVHPGLETPILSMHPEYQNYYQSNGINPIVIYPEKIRDNPLQAKKVVRWLLAPPGLYGGPTEFPGEDIWSYLPGIARNMGSDKVLRIPVSDTSIFYPPEQRYGGRAGACFYAHKYDKIHGKELLPITDGMTRIEGKPEVVADLLRKSNACYTYENSQIIQEAQLCGCPVVLIRTEYFNQFPESAGHIAHGIRWHDELGYITKDGPDWIPAVQHLYEKLHWEFEGQLERFIKKTQEL